MNLRFLLFCASALLLTAVPVQARSVDSGAKSFAKDSKDLYKKEMRRYLEQKKQHDAEQQGNATPALPTAEENKQRALPQILQKLTYHGTVRPDYTKPYYIFILVGRPPKENQELAAEYSYARSMQFLPPFYKQIKKEGKAEVVMLWMGELNTLRDFRAKFGNKFAATLLTPALEQQLPELRMTAMREYDNDISIQLLDADGKFKCEVGNAPLITTLMRQTW